VHEYEVCSSADSEGRWTGTMSWVLRQPQVFM